MKCLICNGRRDGDDVGIPPFATVPTTVDGNSKMTSLDLQLGITSE